MESRLYWKRFCRLLRIDSSLRLLLLGNGSEARKVREFISVHRLGGVIRTLGPYGKEDMPKWFRAADTYLSCYAVGWHIYFVVRSDGDWTACGVDRYSLQPRMGDGEL